MFLRIVPVILVFTTLLCSGCRRDVAVDDARAADAPLPYAVNINTASTDELERIPHVGERVAAKIIEHRTANGPFRRVEHLMLVPGISDKRFRKIRPFVKAE